MSGARLLATVAARLAADGPLDDLLARHPDDASKPAILSLSRREQESALVFDCLTVRLATDTPDARFGPRPSAPSGDAVGTHEVELLAWTQTPDVLPLESISARLDALLHRQAFSLLTLNDDTAPLRVFLSERILRLPDNFDVNRQAWYSRARYRFQIQE
jgi:hypothetical protein